MENFIETLVVFSVGALFGIIFCCIIGGLP